jgi:hypothetical protein
MTDDAPPRTLVEQLLADTGYHVDPAAAELEVDHIDAADGRRYMTRYYLARTRRYSVRLHRLWTSDPGRDLHDHPWDYTSCILSGGYRETTPDGTAEYQAPAILHRPAEWLHRLDLLDGAPVWTLVATGPVRRTWGFSTAAGWQAWHDYEGAGDIGDERGPIQAGSSNRIPTGRARRR